MSVNASLQNGKLCTGLVYTGTCLFKSFFLGGTLGYHDKV